MFRLSSVNLGWLGAYVAMLTVLVMGLHHYRDVALAEYGSDDAAAQWRSWREAAGELGRDGPVQRRKPKSAEPPALVLMRDHFMACLGVSLLLSSCLFLWLMFSARGAMKPIVLPYEEEL